MVFFIYVKTTTKIDSKNEAVKYLGEVIINSQILSQSLFLERQRPSVRQSGRTYAFQGVNREDIQNKEDMCPGMTQHRFDSVITLCDGKSCHLDGT